MDRACRTAADLNDPKDGRGTEGAVGLLLVLLVVVEGVVVLLLLGLILRLKEEGRMGEWPRPWDRPLRAPLAAVRSQVLGKLLLLLLLLGRPCV